MKHIIYNLQFTTYCCGWCISCWLVLKLTQKGSNRCVNVDWSVKKKSECEADTMWWMSESADNRLWAGVLCFVRYFIHNNILIVSLNWAAVWKYVHLNYANNPKEMLYFDVDLSSSSPHSSNPLLRPFTPHASCMDIVWCHFQFTESICFAETTHQNHTNPEAFCINQYISTPSETLKKCGSVRVVLRGCDNLILPVITMFHQKDLWCLNHTAWRQTELSIR